MAVNRWALDLVRLPIPPRSHLPNHIFKEAKVFKITLHLPVVVMKIAHPNLVLLTLPTKRYTLACWFLTLFIFIKNRIPVRRMYLTIPHKNFLASSFFQA